MTLGEMIADFREREHISQREFARRCGLSNAIISRIEQGEGKKPTRQNIETYAKIARVMGIDLTAMFRELGAYAIVPFLPEGVMPVSDINSHKIPLIGKVAAGEPITAEEDLEGFVMAPAKADYALEIEGESMSPTYLPGDIVYIRRQDTLDFPGQVSVVLLDDEATVKHVYTQPDGLMLISDNPDYPPMYKRFSDYSTVRILGKVCGFTRMYG